MKSLLRRLWPLVLGALAMVALVLTGRRSGQLEQRLKRAQERERAYADTLDRQAQGRAAVARGRASGRSPDQRLRDNDGAW
jgi:hypothetical protein